MLAIHFVFITFFLEFAVSSVSSDSNFNCLQSMLERTLPVIWKKAFIPIGVEFHRISLFQDKTEKSEIPNPPAIFCI